MGSNHFTNSSSVVCVLMRSRQCCHIRDMPGRLLNISRGIFVFRHGKVVNKIVKRFFGPLLHFLIFIYAEEALEEPVFNSLI